MSMAAKRPQLNLDELRRLKWLLGGLLALVSFWTVFFLDIEALELVGVASAVVVAALVRPDLPARVPGLVWRLAVPAIIGVIALDFVWSPDTLPVLIRLAILLVLYRAASYRRKREDLQLIVLGLFLVVVAGVLTVSLGFAFLLLLFTAVALGLLFVVTLIDMTEQTAVALTFEEMSQCPGWARGGWGRVLRRVAQVADWRLLALAGALFAGVVAMSAVLFLIIPRFEMASGFFLDKYITRKSRTGFSEVVRFGDVSELVRDESVALRVDLTDAGSLAELPYWRVVVLDEYTPQGFRMSLGLKNELLRSQRVLQYLRSGRPRAVSVGGQWTIYVEPGVSRFLPLPGGFSLLRLREMLPVQMSGALQLVALRSEPMTMSAFQLDGVELRGAITDRRFAALLASRTAESDAGGTGDGRTMDPFLTLRGPAGPANAAAVEAVVRVIDPQRTLTAVEFAARAGEWLRSRHPYALAASIPKGTDTDDIVRWLESEEAGFCEYFASALAVLCRAAGHPARVIAGYHGGTLNAFESYLMVRNSDAHAWVEVFDGGESWVRFDPTANAVAIGGTAQARAMSNAQDSSWNARWDSLRVIWYRRIVNFDQRAQGAMLEQVRSLTAGSGEALRARLEALGARVKEWLTAPWSVKRTGKWLALLVAAGVAVFSGFRLLRYGWQRWREWRRPGEYDPVRREAGRWLVRLRLAGIASEVGEDLERLRFGARETWPEPGPVFRRARQARRNRT